MKRYLYYIAVFNMVGNMVGSLPKILIENRMEGTILSILLSVIPGLFFVFVFLYFFNQFKGKGLPEILQEHTNEWIANALLIISIIFWFIAGLVTLTSFSFMLKRFLSPETSLVWITIIILLFISYAMVLRTRSVLFGIEMIFVIAVPMILLFSIKGFTSPDLEWDFVKKAVMYVNHPPSLSALSASTYMYLGVANIIIFNREFIEGINFKWKDFLLIGYFALSCLIVSFFLPVGINGFDTVHSIIYPGVTTSDSLRMPYGIIERVLYVALALVITVTYINIVIHWHVVLELLKSMTKNKQLKWKNLNLKLLLFVSIFWAISLAVILYLDEYQLISYTTIFFNLLMFLFIGFCFVFWAVLRRRRG